LNIYDEAQNVEVPGLGEDGRNIWLTIPMPGVPPRNASVGPMSSPGEPHVKFKAQEGRDYRWQHLIFIVDSQGNLVDDWSRWDSKFKRVHKILISPYDPEKRVWVDDDGKCAIFIFSNDGKQLLQTFVGEGQLGLAHAKACAWPAGSAAAKLFLQRAWNSSGCGIASRICFRP
jgi:hypothetical protein